MINGYMSIRIMSALSLFFLQVPLTFPQKMSMGYCPIVSRVADFDLEKFMGVWYQQATVSSVLKDDVTCTKYTYKPGKHGSFIIDSKMTSKSDELLEIHGVAKPKRHNHEIEAGHFSVISRDGEYLRSMIKLSYRSGELLEIHGVAKPKRHNHEIEAGHFSVISRDGEYLRSMIKLSYRSGELLEIHGVAKPKRHNHEIEAGHFSVISRDGEYLRSMIKLSYRSGELLEIHGVAKPKRHNHEIEAGHFSVISRDGEYLRSMIKLSYRSGELLEIHGVAKPKRHNHEIEAGHFSVISRDESLEILSRERMFNTSVIVSAFPEVRRQRLEEVYGRIHTVDQLNCTDVQEDLSSFFPLEHV
ncbi:uncharacterized protein LOC124362839 isoform X2 [Homalodisca vitripennis]|uniref:uncharacterized protein LOC124362839 isoform X2 n=1 Tax=Homalodisca vitripennis TaxID=197043 RepID=UPI001EEA41E2|nr:uncharacterized protein LOC124362839 isoform X2 [Homalodisca vitripennis]